MPPARPLSLITGASAGIGATFARALAAYGHDLVLTARRHDRLEKLASAIRQEYNSAVVVISADLANPLTPRMLCKEISLRDLTVDWLINNAGYGVPGTFLENDWKKHADALQVLLNAPTELAWRLLPAMCQRGYGRIINVASLAGHVPGTPKHTLYGASKAYLVKFSQSLALENRDNGIHVCALCPGFTHSEFHDVTGTRALVEKLPHFMWQTTEEVVREGIEAVEHGKIVHVTGRVNRFIKTLFKLTPDRLTLRLSARQAHYFRRQD